MFTIPYVQSIVDSFIPDIPGNAVPRFMCITGNSLIRIDNTDSPHVMIVEDSAVRYIFGDKLTEVTISYMESSPCTGMLFCDNPHLEINGSGRYRLRDYCVLHSDNFSQHSLRAGSAVPVTFDEIHLVAPIMPPWMYEKYESLEHYIATGLVFVSKVDHVPACLAGCYALSNRYADIGVVTLPMYRRLNLAFDACSTLFSALQMRHLNPQWVTQSDHAPSLALGRKLGLNQSRRITVYEPL